MASGNRIHERHPARNQNRGFNRSLVLMVCLLLFLVIIASLSHPWWPRSAHSEAGRSGVFASSFSGPDRLITNEFAHWNPQSSATPRSPDWDVTSGSLFARDGVGWSGKPDMETPDATSTTSTGSSVLRMTTRRTDFRDARVSLQLRNLGVVSDSENTVSNIDGVHILLRWQSPVEFYVVSINRRDDYVVIKKKLPGGDEEGGHYITLGWTHHPVMYGTWQTWMTQISTDPKGKIVIEATEAGHLVLTASDQDTEESRISRAGAVGLRADNCEFELRDFRAVPL